MIVGTVFYITAIMAIVGGLGVVLFKQPIRSVLSLVLVMLALSVQFLLLSAQFVGAVQIIVYAGAVMVLFLFVIALLGPISEHPTQRLRFQPWLAVPFVIVFMIMGYALLQQVKYRNPLNSSPLNALGTVENVALGLFSTYLYPFELTSLLLLIAAVGAIYLSRREG